MKINSTLIKFRERLAKIPSPYLILAALTVILFILIDVFKINNYSGGPLFLTVSNIMNILNHLNSFIADTHFGHKNIIKYEDDYILVIHKLGEALKKLSEPEIKHIYAALSKELKTKYIIKFPSKIQFTKCPQIPLIVEDYINKLDVLMNGYQLSDSSTIRDYYVSWWKKALRNYNINPDHLNKLIQRLAFNDKGYKIKAIELDGYKWFRNLESNMALYRMESRFHIQLFVINYSYNIYLYCY
jgi:hypothetical protein